MDVGITGRAAVNAYNTQIANRNKSSKPDKSEKSNRTENTHAEEIKKFLNSSKFSGVTKSETYGNVIGQPELSDKAAEYYNSLKEKFGDAEFVLVSNDSLEGAEAKAAAMNSGGKTIVLIDAEKIERMAEDEDYRNQIENTISTGKTKLDEIAEQMKGMKSITGFGMRVHDDGSTSFFAVARKNNDEINRQMAEKREAKKAEAKKANKKAERRRNEERLEERRKENRAENNRINENRIEENHANGNHKQDDFIKEHDLDIRPEKPFVRDKAIEKTNNRFNDKEDFEFIEADTAEDLLRMCSDFEYEFLSNNIMTPEEGMVGSNIDFSL